MRAIRNARLVCRDYPSFITNMIDVVLLELDHIVFDTRSIRESCLEAALAAHQLSNISDADEVIADLVALSATREFAARISASGLVMQPGARAFLEQAAGMARVGVVTSATRSEVDTMLRLAGLDDLFAVRVCADDVLMAKPAADGYNLALERLDRRRPVRLRNVLALERDAAGIRAARRAGMRCVAVGPIAAHIAIDADALIDSLAGHSLASLDRLSRPGMERVQ